MRATTRGGLVPRGIPGAGDGRKISDRVGTALFVMRRDLMFAFLHRRALRASPTSREERIRIVHGNPPLSLSLS